MAVGINKLTDSENDFLDSIELVIENVRESDPKKADQMTAELQTMIDNAKFFNNTNLRRIFFQKQMAKSDFFSDKQGMQDILKASGSDRTLPNEYWTPSSDADIKATNVSQIDSKGFNKDFFNWDSDRHWTKLSPTEIKETADYMKMSPQDLLNEVRDEQTKRDREGLFSFSKDPLAFGASIMMPRTAEAIMRGEDPDKLRDVAMDFGENLVYSLNPGGKAANLGTKAIKPASKYSKKAIDLLGAGVEPALMEGADALVYGDNDNTDRKNFDYADVLIGTGVNKFMGSITPDIKPKAKPKKTIYEPNQVKEFNEAMDKVYNDEMLKELKNKADIAEIANNPDQWQNYSQMWQERLSKLTKEAKSKEPKPRARTAKDLVEYAATQNAPGALNVTTNRTGDVLSEDPRFQNRALRLLGGRTFAPYLIDFTKEARTEDEKERKKVYDLLGR